MKNSVLIVAPLPPPFHGASYAVQLLLNSEFVKDNRVYHINTTFVSNIAEFHKFSLKKLNLSLNYLLQIVHTLLSNSEIETVILLVAPESTAYYKDVFYSLVCRLFFRKNVIWWIHTGDLKRLEQGGKLHSSLTRITLLLPSVIVTVGDVFKEKIYRNFPDIKVHTIHNSLPDGNIKPRIKKKNSIIITYLSNMIKSKGWNILFVTAELICEEIPFVQFDFYGNPRSNSAGEQLELKFALCRYPERIQYHGSVYGLQKEEILKNTDIFCLPTYYSVEAFPFSILEAMQYGLPVVTTDHAAISEAIINEQGGFTIPVRDKESLYQKLVYLIEHPEVRTKMGEYNRKRFEHYFTLEKHVDRWNGIVSSFAK